MDNLFTTKSLSVGYNKGFIILDNINITIQAGDISALIGPNGSGKSTLVRTLSGLQKPIAGTYQLKEGLTISLVPQVKKMHFEYPLSIRKVLSLEKEARNFSFNKHNFTKEEMEIIEKIGVKPLLSLLVKECSGGQLQKVLIARALLSMPQLIFLDEPMDALDKSSRESILYLFKEYAQKYNSSLFIITHHISET
ncbi:MAG: ATP-binding cassette domain-containing protein, partial [Leptospiraceae bacterium]|nr:ATP-binding cassette domain-containing protein [Leptospiraceae bacterium]